jgi:hypothetical protein
MPAPAAIRTLEPTQSAGRRFARRDPGAASSC